MIVFGGSVWDRIPGAGVRVRVFKGDVAESLAKNLAPEVSILFGEVQWEGLVAALRNDEPRRPVSHLADIERRG